MRSTTHRLGRIQDVPAAAPPPHARRIVSFVQRSGRLDAQARRIWDAHAADYLIDVPRDTPQTSLADDWRLDTEVTFGRAAPLVVEIGSGRGETLVAAALMHPERNHLACEVYTPGVAKTVSRLSHESVSNVRIIQADAVHLLHHGLAPASVTELWVFFPDPWHKLRHRKRRLVSLAFAELAARVLVPGGIWRLATDWPDYAVQIEDVIVRSPDFVGGITSRFGLRPVTRFERKAHDEGRSVTDFTAVRR